MVKFYNNVPLVADVDETNPQHLTTVGAVHDKLWEKKTKTIVDVIEHYELASAQDGSEGLIIVDDGTLSNPNVEIELSSVQGKLLDTDVYSYVAGEYVVLIPEQNHEQEYEESIYLPRSEIPEGSTTMTIQKLDDMWGTVTVKPYVAS